MMVSAVHNNWRNQTTGLSPNQILIRYDIPLQTPNDIETNNALVEWQIGIMNKRREQAIEALNKTVEKSSMPSAQYNTGDQVWLEGKNLQLPHQVTKLAPKRYRPFKIIKEISPVAYWLQLPPTWTVHDVFHTSLLSPYSKTPSCSPNFSQPSPDLIRGEEEYEVESICSHQYFGRNKKLQFLIRWKGYAPSDDTWEPADSVHTPDLVKEYKQRTPGFHINNNPNNSSHSITLSPLWHPFQPGSLEPNPHCSRHLVPFSFTTSTQSTSARHPLPTDLTSSLALHYAQIPRVHSRASYSPHLHSHPPTHILLSGGQERNSLPISQSHLCPRLTPCPPPRGPSRLHTSPPHAHHPPNLFPFLDCSLTPATICPSHPEPLLTNSVGTSPLTRSPSRVYANPCASRFALEKTTSTTNGPQLLNVSSASKNDSRSMRRPSNGAQKVTRSTPATLDSKSTWGSGCTC